MVRLWLEWKLLALMGKASSLRKEEKLSQISTNHLHLQTAAGRLGRGPKSLLPIITSMWALPLRPVPAATSGPVFLISWPSWATLVAFFQDESWL